MSRISGADSTGSISNVTLQDMSIGGTTITAGNASSKIDVGSNVSGLNYGFVSGGVYTLNSRYNGLTMDNGNPTANNSPVIQWPSNVPETTSQQWVLRSVCGNTYTLVSLKSGLALDNAGSSNSPSALVQWTLHNQIQQQWTITSLGSGLYKVISAQSGDALDDNHIAPGTKSTNTHVVQHTPNGGDTQQWKLTKQ